MRGPLAGDVTAQILNTLLVGVLCFYVFDVVVIIWWFALHKATSMAQASVIALLFAIALILLHRGSLRAASLLYLSGIWVLATVAIILNGGIHSPGVVFYVALPISAAWLLGDRAALLSGAICLAASLAMAVLEQTGHALPRYLPGRPLAIWASIVVAMIIAAVPVAQVLKILKGLLAQSESAREALRESEERFRNMADSAPVMIWVTGPDKLCTFFNKVWLDFTGRTMEEELGEGWTQGVHPDDLARCIYTYSEAFDARRGFLVEYRLRRKDGVYRWVMDKGVPLFAPRGVFAGYIGSCIDTTNIKRSQEEALAKQKLETVGQLARGIAHDFNNLLGGILATAEVGLTSRAEGSHPDEELLTIRTAAIRGGEIVRQLLTYGRDDASAFDRIDLSLLVHEMLQLLKATISKHAVLETDLAGDLPPVCGNPAQIRQVVMNLVTNASEAIGDRAGVIRVTTARVRAGRGALQGADAQLPAGDYLRLEVSDTGNGMTPEVLARIFDLFFTTKSTGQGLGLAAVQRIVGGHRGAINVASEVGQGTCFEVLLPCVAQAPRHPHEMETSASEVPSTINGTILVVEDEDTLRCAVSRMLRRNGLSVIEMSNGAAAMNFLRNNETDIAVILLDLTLPGMGGLEILAESRRLRPSTNVILTSAYGQDALQAAGGKQAFIRKPYRLSDLWELILAASGQKEMADTARSSTSV